MAKKEDSIVASIYETHDYDKFVIIPENRGRKDNKGLKDRKLLQLQKKIDDGDFMFEIARVKVNEDFHIIDGRHTFETMKRNKFPVRYEIIHDAKFNNGVSKKDYIGSIYEINSINTAWTGFEMFNSAVQIKFPLAIIIQELIEQYENTFTWIDIVALLQKDADYFMGRWRSLKMDFFKDKEMLHYIKSAEFDTEFKWFVKLNAKARVAYRKKVVLHCVYGILFNAREIINPLAFRKAALTIPDSMLESMKTASQKTCTKMLVDYYNKSQGQSVTSDAILYKVKNKGEENFIQL